MTRAIPHRRRAAATTTLVLLLGVPPLATAATTRPVVVVPAAPKVNSASASTAMTGSGAIIHPLQLTQTSGLSFGRMTLTSSQSAGTITIPAAAPSRPVTLNATANSAANASAAVFTLRGEAGRAYTLSTPAAVRSTPSGFPVTAITVWTKSAGNIAGGSAVLNTSGTDTIRVGGTLAVPRGTAAQTYTARVPITVAYQ